jgi:hypothetical protein
LDNPELMNPGLSDMMAGWEALWSVPLALHGWSNSAGVIIFDRLAVAALVLLSTVDLSLMCACPLEKAAVAGFLECAGESVSGSDPGAGLSAETDSGRAGLLRGQCLSA